MAEVEELLLGERLAAEAELQDRHVEALYLMISGGVVPGGNCLSSVCEMAVTCATAVSIFAPGWKKTLMTAMPCSDWVSMCSMSLTVVVRRARRSR